MNLCHDHFHSRSADIGVILAHAGTTAVLAFKIQMHKTNVTRHIAAA
jgi:hypothetical protein